MTALVWSLSFVRALKRKARRRSDLRERILENEPSPKSGQFSGKNIRFGRF